MITNAIDSALQFTNAKSAGQVVRRHDTRKCIQGCSFCHKLSTKVRGCSGCGVCYYCDNECRNKAWPVHKFYCRKGVAKEYEANYATAIALRDIILDSPEFGAKFIISFGAILVMDIIVSDPEKSNSPSDARYVLLTFPRIKDDKKFRIIFVNQQLNESWIMNLDFEKNKHVADAIHKDMLKSHGYITLVYDHIIMNPEGSGKLWTEIKLFWTKVKRQVKNAKKRTESQLILVPYAGNYTLFSQYYLPSAEKKSKI